MHDSGIFCHKNYGEELTEEDDVKELTPATSTKELLDKIRKGDVKEDPKVFKGPVRVPKSTQR
jgi:hypothetical protein